MQIKFSQSWAKKKYEKPLRDAVTFVKGSRSCKDLLVKVFFYVNKGGSRGNYRNVSIHGSYSSDPHNVTSIITLKCSDRVFYDPSVLTSDEQKQLNLKKATHGRMHRERSLDDMTENFVSLFAHEFKHYLDMKGLHDKSKFRHWEVRAEKFSKQQLEKWKMRTEVKKNGER